VAVIGSVALTRYQDHMTTALEGRHLPTSVSDAILGSLGGALGVAHAVGGATGNLLGAAARACVHERFGSLVLSGRIVALGGILIVLATCLRLPPILVRIQTRTTRMTQRSLFLAATLAVQLGFPGAIAAIVAPCGAC
jgi:hypothetical protein